MNLLMCDNSTKAVRVACSFILSRVARALMLLMPLIVPLMGRSQQGFNYHFAGNDTTVFRDTSKEWRYGTVRLGNTDPQWCYEWSVPEGELVEEGDNGLYVIVRPRTKGPHFYTATCVTDFGYFEDMVCVTVEDTAYFISVEPLFECYERHDVINLEDFKITAYPEGVMDELLVRYSPYFVMGPSDGPLDSIEVVFELYDVGDIVYSTASVKMAVYEKNNPLDIVTDAAVNLSIGSYLNAIKFIDEVKEKRREFQSIISTLKNLAPVEPAFEFSFDISGALDPRNTHTCCNHHSIDGIALSGSIAGSIALSLNGIHLAGIPHVAELTLNTSFPLSLSITAPPNKFFLYDNNPCNENSLPMKLSFLPKVKLVGYLGDPDLLSLSAGVFVGPSITFDFYDNSENPRTFDMEAGLVFDMVVVGFYNPSFTIALPSMGIKF